MNSVLMYLKIFLASEKSKKTEIINCKLKICQNMRFLTLSSLRRHFTPSTVWLGGVIPLKSGGLDMDFMDDSSELTLYKDPVFNLGRLCLSKIQK